MLNLFKRSSVRKAPATKEIKPGVKSAVQDARLEQKIMKNADREVYMYDQPEQQMGMSDLVQQHQSGQRFLYAAVTANQAEDDSSRLRRLLSFQPKVSRRPISIGDVPTLALYSEVESFDLSRLLPASRSKVKTYINISDVVVVYGSLISTDSTFSKVRVSIVDDRLLNNKIAKSYIATTNVMSKANMNLSYCFPRDEIDAIRLTVSREAAFLEQGRQWGAVQVLIQMEESEFPIQNSNVAVRAINTIPQSLMEDREVDPDFIDISIVENNRKQLRDIYMDGDLADETEPIKNRTDAVKYAKSSLAGPKGKKAEQKQTGEWGFMNEQRQAGVNEELNSIDPSEAGFDSPPVTPPSSGPIVKSILKRSPPSPEGDTIVPEEESSVEEIVRPPTPPKTRKVTVVDPKVDYDWMS
jgi:hypothetical protein